MSDTDTDPSLDPSDFIVRDQRRTMAQALPSPDDDPEKAARAVELGEVTGDHPAVIYPNLESYEAQHKAALTSDLIRNNAFLRQYIQADPIHAKVSADDWGNLDANSQAWTKLSLPMKAVRFPERVAAGSEAVLGSVAEGAIRGYKQGAVAGGGVGDWAFLAPGAKDHPLLSTLQGVGWAPFEIGTRFISGTIEGIKEGAYQGAYTLARQMGSGDQGAEQFAREIGAMAEAEAMGLTGRHGGPHVEEPIPEPGKAIYIRPVAEDGKPEPFKPEGPLKKIADMTEAARPWLDVGLEPPAGLHPEIDKLKYEQNKLDVDNLDEVFSTAGATATGERSAKILETFGLQHTDADVGISGDAIAKLYGDKAPSVDDNLFGWVPGIAEKLEVAKATGGDVHIPVAAWATRVKDNPELWQELKDFTRVRPGSITKGERDGLAEAKEGLPEPPKPETPLPEPLPQVRASAGFEPLFAVGDRKLELKRMAGAEKGQPGAIFPDATFHDFDLLDENGVKRGALNLSEQKGGKQLYVEMVQGGGTSKMYDPNFFGPALMRSLLRQIKEQFPNAESITGHRVSGAREAAGTYEAPHAMPVIKFSDELNHESAIDFQKILEGQHLDFASSTIHYSPLLEGKEAEADKAIRDELAKLTPGVKVFTPSSITATDKPGISRFGTYYRFTTQNPWIVVSLESTSPLGTARHEAIHHLRQYGFLKEGEWDTLVRKAKEDDWVGKFKIDDAYQGLSASEKLEESIAEGYRYWRRGEDLGGSVHPIFEKLKQFFLDLHSRLKEIIGKDFTWEELFQKIDRGDIGAREGAKPIHEGMFQEAAQDIPETPSVFDRGSIMTKEAHDLYMELIAKRHAEDLEAASRRAEKEQRREQTADWKDNRAVLRNEVEADLHSRPDVAADLFLGVGDYLGQKLSTKPRVRESDLSPEQRSAIPRHYYSKDGFPADDIANLFGYPSGGAMLDRLAQYNAAKSEAKLTTREFLDKAIEAETDRQMKAKYGDLETSILDEAKDQALSETQLNLLHEEMLALGLKAKASGTLDKATIRGQLKDMFDKTLIGSISSEKFLANAGRTKDKIEIALLKEDYSEAYRQAQIKFNNTQMAVYAKSLEKAKVQFDRLVKRYSKREVSGASPEYTDAVHDILSRLGETNGRRTIQDLQESYRLNGYENLADFINTKQAQLRDLHTPDWVQDPAFRKPTEELTTQEFEEVHNALKAITFNSRDELKVNKAGEKADLEAVLDEMIGKIQSLGPARPHPKEESWVGRQVRNFYWAGINVESMLNRLDRGDAKSIFYQTITHQFTEASNYKEKLIKDFQAKINAIGDIDGMYKQVENSLFKNPETGEAIPMRQHNVLGILQNVGNALNLNKLAKGYGLTPSEVLDWLHQRTTKDDWDRAQKIGDIFNEIFDLANRMSHDVSGVGIQRRPLSPIDTPHGTYPGWYNPIKYDPFIPGKSKKLMGPQAIEDEGYFRANTPQGYTKDVTGYIAPVDLSLDIVPQRMKQMIHDIAMRPAVLQLSKFFYDNRFERAMTNYYSAHTAKSMIPFLRDIANAPNFKSWTEQLGAEGLEYLRQNMMATLIGFNPGTVMKHGTTAWINSMTQVGALDYLREFKNITAQTVTGRVDWKMAMEKSEELQRRSRNFKELIEGQGSAINLSGAKSIPSSIRDLSTIPGAQATLSSLRDVVTTVGAKPVAISDLLSAVPTWLAEYKRQIASGETEGMSISYANRAVRQAHGSSVISNKPAIMRGNPAAAFLTSLYGFFSHMQQKQYELAWKARDMLAGQRDVKETAPDLLRGLFSYVIAPAIIEELVTPMTNKDNESWGVKSAKTMAMGISSSYVGIRDFVRAAINLRDPQAGLLGETFKPMTDLARDLSKPGPMFTKEKAGNMLKHSFALNGVLTGLTNAQEGRMAEYMYNYFHNKEHPKGPWDVGVGLRYGTTDKHSRTFDQWKKQTLGGR